MHFRRRIQSHVKHRFRLSQTEYQTLTKEERQRRSLNVLRMASDLCANPKAHMTCDREYHTWVTSERQRLEIDVAIGEWEDKPLEYHLKAKTSRFLRVMRLMSREREMSGGKAFSLFPLRRHLVPRHVRFDKNSLSQTLEALRNERLGRKRKARDEDSFTFSSVLDLRAANVSQRWRVKDGFTTDGVCARIQHAVQTSGKRDAMTSTPRRGIFAIDELKRVSRLEEWHVVGVDPGKRELIVAVDSDDPLRTRVRYTQRQRSKDLRSKQYACEANSEKPAEVRESERELANFHSRTADTSSFVEYCRQSLGSLDIRLRHYEKISHRRRRWKTCIKEQQSETRLFAKLKGIRKDERPLVLAYGSWGTIAGRAGAACNRGNPPCIGVGLMRKLAKHFVVAVTPEHYTSKTCCRCFASCGPHPTKRTTSNHEIRGLRVCQNENCKLIQNRDRTGATNIGTQFKRLFSGLPPLRALTQEEKEFNAHRLCLQCDE
jgi:hypothetical protein